MCLKKAGFYAGFFMRAQDKSQEKQATRACFTFQFDWILSLHQALLTLDEYAEKSPDIQEESNSFPVVFKFFTASDLHDLKCLSV